MLSFLFDKGGRGELRKKEDIWTRRLGQERNLASVFQCPSTELKIRRDKEKETIRPRVGRHHTSVYVGLIIYVSYSRRTSCFSRWEIATERKNAADVLVTSAPGERDGTDLSFVAEVQNTRTVHVSSLSSYGV